MTYASLGVTDNWSIVQYALPRKSVVLILVLCEGAQNPDPKPESLDPKS